MAESNISKNKLQKQLHKILNSKTFKKSARNSTLLEFLFTSYLEDTLLKEQVIGYAIFKEKYDIDKNDSTIRVYMRNLRLKLEEYYNNEGVNDSIVFKIEKGQYNLSCIQNKRAPKNNKILFFSIGGFLILCTVVSIFFLKSNNIKDNLWSPFFKNNTLLFISDEFLFFQKIDKHKEFKKNNIEIVRRYNINNTDDLKQKTTNTVATKFTYFTKLAPHVTKTLGKWFWKHNSDFSIYNETAFKEDNLKNNNIIFTGLIKPNGAGSKLALIDSKEIKYVHDGFIVNKKGNTKTYISHQEDNKRIDYALLSFKTLENGKSVIFAYSNHDFGTISLIDKITNEEWLKKLYKQIPKNNNNFISIFKVTGINYTELSTELVALEIL